MGVLVLGLLLFLGMHSVRIVADGTRSGFIAARGEKAWKGLYTLVSIAGLARGGVTDALTTEQINDLRDERPNWLVREREIQEAVRKEEERVATRDAQRAAKPQR